MQAEVLDAADARAASVRLVAGIIGVLRADGHDDGHIATQLGLGSGLDDDARALIRAAFARADSYGATGPPPPDRGPVPFRIDGETKGASS